MKCQNCNFDNPGNFEFCGKCGQSLTKVHQKKDQLTEMDGERKHVTILFSDLSGYTAMTEKLDPEEVKQIMSRIYKEITQVVIKYEGFIEKFAGDSVMAIFGIPKSHEDDPIRALKAANEIHSIVESMGPWLKEKINRTVTMHSGINTGLVVTGEVNIKKGTHSITGDAVNVAARLQGVAKSDEILVGEQTYNRAMEYFSFEQLKPTKVKGKREPINIYRLIAPISNKTRFDLAADRSSFELVGRQSEMKTLQTTFKEVKEKEPKFIDVIGEAGIGKSRLIHEFQNWIGSDATFITGTCVHLGININFLPLLDIVKTVFKIEEYTNQEESKNKIAETLNNDLKPMTPFFQSLLSLDVDNPMFNALNPEGRKFGTFEAVKNLLLSKAKEKPLVIFLEDVHWIDKISEEFFSYFSKSFLNHPVMMLTAYRPESILAWAQGEHYQQLKLEALSSDDAAKIARNIVGGLNLDFNFEKQIIEKTGCNPLFVEEIINELLDRGHLKKVDDRYICDRPINQIEMPGTIQGVLSARIDRLGDEPKKTLQMASVIGRDFAYRLLKNIMEVGKELSDNLTNLVELEFIYEKAIYPELEYLFKHALTQEVAYNGLLKKIRRQIHGRVAMTMDEIFENRLEEHYEILAYHYELSGNASKAIEYLTLAGEKSNRNQAAKSAHQFFTKALKIAESEKILMSPDAEVRARQGLAAASVDIGAIGIALKQYKRAVEISRENGMVEREMDNLAESAYATWFAPMKGKETLSYYEDSINRAREVGDKAVESRILSWKAMYLCSLGQRYQGFEIAADAEILALPTGDRRAIAINRLIRALTERWIGNPKKTIELTDGMVEELSAIYNINVLAGWVFIRGLALAEYGRISDAIDILNYGINLCEKFGSAVHLGRLYNTLGYCYTEIHQSNEAWGPNCKGDIIGRKLMKMFPMGVQIASEVVAQANVNLMQNLFDKRKREEVWKRIKSLEEESKSHDYDRARDRWESRMNLLKAQILLERNDTDQAEVIIQKNLKKSQKEHIKKYEGNFLRLIAKVQIRRNETENALNSLGKAIEILKDVGNTRLLWEAHSSLASVYNGLIRSSEAKEHWGIATEYINNTANRLSEKKLKEAFLKAEPIREIFSKAVC